MDADDRTEEDIRSEIAAECEALAEAVASVRRDLRSKRRPAMRVIAIVGLAALAFAALRVLRRRRSAG